eukprot:augustus_masked-scaffold_15-processed-gene-8.12-mRNA-1 protein AED:0.49 eAED:0.49 QI:0/-1/0/1/-1/1/1/0/2603
MGQICGKAKALKFAQPFCNMSKEDVYDLWEGFQDVAEGFGLNIEEFCEIILTLQGSFFAHSKKSAVVDLAEIFFRAMDTDGNGLIDSFETFCGLAALSAMSNKDKLKFFFMLFDFDEDKKINVDEMVLLLRSIVYGVEKLTDLHRHVDIQIPDELRIEEFCHACFKLFDIDMEDGILARACFLKFCIETPEIYSWITFFDNLSDYNALPTAKQESRFKYVEEAEISYNVKNLGSLQDELARNPNIYDLFVVGFYSSLVNSNNGLLLKNRALGFSLSKIKSVLNGLLTFVNPDDPCYETLELLTQGRDLALTKQMVKEKLTFLHGVEVRLQWVVGVNSMNNLFNSGSLAYVGRKVPQEIAYAAGNKLIVHDTVANVQRIYTGCKNYISCMTFCSMTNLVAVGERAYFPSIYFVDTESLHTVQYLPHHHTCGIKCLDFSQDGKYLLSVGMDDTRTVSVFHVLKGDRIFCKKSSASGIILDAKFQPCESGFAPHFVTCGVNHVHFWKFRDQASEKKSVLNRYGSVDVFFCISSVSLNRKGNTESRKRTLCGSLSGLVFVFNEERSLLRTIRCHDSVITKIVYLKERNEFVSVGFDGKARFMSAELEKIKAFDVVAYGCNSALICDVVATENEQKIALVYSSGVLCEVSVEDGTQSAAGPIQQCCGIGLEPTVNLFSADSFTKLTNLESSHNFSAMAIHPEKSEFFLAANDYYLRKFDFQSHSPLKARKYDYCFKCLCYTVNGCFIVAGVGETSSYNVGSENTSTHSGAYIVISGETMIPVLQARDTTKALNDIQLSPDGKWMAAAGEDSFIYLYTVKEETKTREKNLIFELEAKIKGHKNPVVSVEFSKDSLFIRSLGQKKTLLFHDVNSIGSVKPELVKFAEFHQPHAKRVSEIASFYKKERTIIQRNGYDEFQVSSCFFSSFGTDFTSSIIDPGNNFLFLGEHSGAVRLYNVFPGHEHLSKLIELHSSQTSNILYAPNFQQLFSQENSGTIYLFRVQYRTEEQGEHTSFFDEVNILSIVEDERQSEDDQKIILQLEHQLRLFLESKVISSWNENKRKLIELSLTSDLSASSRLVNKFAMANIPTKNPWGLAEASNDLNGEPWLKSIVKPTALANPDFSDLRGTAFTENYIYGPTLLYGTPLFYLDTNEICYCSGRYIILHQYNRLINKLGEASVTSTQRVFWGHKELCTALEYHKKTSLTLSADFSVEHGCDLLVWDIYSLEVKMTHFFLSSVPIVQIKCAPTSTVGIVRFDDICQTIIVYDFSIGLSLHKCSHGVGDILQCKFTPSLKGFIVADCSGISYYGLEQVKQNPLLECLQIQRQQNRLNSYVQKCYDFCYLSSTILCGMESGEIYVSQLVEEFHNNGEGTFYLTFEQSFFAHGSAVTTTQIANGALLTGSTDGKVKLWSTKFEEIYSYDCNKINLQDTVCTLFQNHLDSGVSNEVLEIISLVWVEENNIMYCLIRTQLAVALLQINLGSGIVTNPSEKNTQKDYKNVSLITEATLNTKVYAMAVSPDSLVFAVIGETPIVRVYDITAQTCVKAMKLPLGSSCLSFSPCGNFLAVGLGTNPNDESTRPSRYEMALDSNRMHLHSQLKLSGGFVVLRNVNLGNDILEIRHEGRDAKKYLTALQYSPNGNLLVCGSFENKLYIYDVNNEYTLQNTAELYTSYIQKMDFSNCGKFLRVNTNLKELIFFSLDTNTVEKCNEYSLKDTSFCSESCQLQYGYNGLHNNSVQKTWMLNRSSACQKEFSISVSDKSKTTALVAFVDSYGSLRITEFPSVGAQERQEYGYPPCLLYSSLLVPNVRVFSDRPTSCHFSCDSQFLLLLGDSNLVQQLKLVKEPSLLLENSLSIYQDKTDEIGKATSFIEQVAFDYWKLQYQDQKMLYALSTYNICAGVPTRPWFKSIVQRSPINETDPELEAKFSDSTPLSLSTQKPEAELELEFLFGSRFLDTQNGLTTIQGKKVVYSSGCHCVVLNILENTQEFISVSFSISAFDVHKKLGVLVVGCEIYPAGPSQNLTETTRISFHDIASTNGLFTIDNLQASTVEQVKFNQKGDRLVAILSNTLSGAATSLRIYHCLDRGWSSGTLFFSFDIHKKVFVVIPLLQNMLVTGGVSFLSLFTNSNIYSPAVLGSEVDKLEERDRVYSSGDVSESTSQVFVGTNYGELLEFEVSMKEFVDSKLVLKKVKIWSEHAFTVCKAINRGNSCDILFATRGGEIKVLKDATVLSWQINIFSEKVLKNLLFKPKCDTIKAIDYFTEDNTLSSIVVGLESGEIYQISYLKKTLALVMSSHTIGEVGALAVCPVKADSDEFIVTTGDDGFLNKFNVTKKRLTNTRHVGPSRAVCCSTNGQFLAVGLGVYFEGFVNTAIPGKASPKAKDGSVLIFDEDFELQYELRDSTERITCVKFSPTDKLLAVAVHDHIYIYDVEAAFSLLFKLKELNSAVTNMDFDSSGEYIRASTTNYDLKYFNLEKKLMIHAVSSLKDLVYETQNCCFTYDVQGVWPEINDTAYDILSIDVSPKVSVFESRDDSISVSGNQFVAVGDNKGFLKLYSYPAHLREEFNNHVCARKAHGFATTYARFSCNGSKVFALGGIDRTISIWRIKAKPDI